MKPRLSMPNETLLSHVVSSCHLSKKVSPRILPVQRNRQHAISATRGNRTGLLFHRATPTTIQAGQHGNDETRIEVHRSFIQHCSLALITSIHNLTLTRGITQNYQPKVPLVRRKRPSDRFINEPFSPVDFDSSPVRKRLDETASTMCRLIDR